MMKWTNKFGTAIASALAFGLVLTGCTAGEQQAPAGGGSPAEVAATEDDGTFLKIEWLGNEKTGIDAIVTAFREANPDIQVVVTTADTAPYQASLRTQLSTGTAADVFFVWPADGNAGAIRQLEAGELLADLSDEPWAAKYPESIRNLVSIDGSVKIMAPLATSFSPVYNQDTLDEANLKAPSTWSEVIPFCQAARSADKYAWALPGNNLYAGQGPFYNLVADLVYGANRDFDQALLDDTTGFDTEPGYQEAMKKYEEMFASECFQPNQTGTPYDESNRMVAEGEAFGSFFIGTRLAALQAIAPEGNFRLYPFHSDDDPNTNAMTLSTQGGGAVNAKSPRQPTARLFLQFLADNISIYKEAQPGTVPVVSEGYVAASENEQLLLDYLDAGYAIQFLNQYWPNARIESVMVNGIQGMMNGTQTGQQVLDAMQVERKTD